MDCGESAKDKSKNIPLVNELIIELESLHHSGSKKHDIVIIDEIDSVLNSWISETHKDKLEKNWFVFNHLLVNAKKVFMMDAFLSMKSINFIKNLNYSKYAEFPDQVDKSMKVVARKTPNEEYEIVTINPEKNKYETWLKYLCDSLKSGKNIYVFYPFCTGNKSYTSMDQLKQYIIKECYLKDDDIVDYNAKVNDCVKKGITNVDKIWDTKRCILVNTSITVGVNYQGNHFHEIFFAWADFVRPRDGIQSCYRIRNLKDKKINLVKLKQFSQNKTDFKKPNFQDPDYLKLLEDVFIEERAKYNFDTFKYFCGLANFKFTNSITEQISKENAKEIQLLLADTNCAFDYNKIPDLYDSDYLKEIYNKETQPFRRMVDGIEIPQEKLNEQYINTFEDNQIQFRYEVVEKLEKKIWSCQASMNDKLIIDKYNFKKLFANKDNANIEAFWKNGTSRRFTFAMYEYLNSKDNILKEIEKEIKCSLIDITKVKDLKLSIELKKKIKEHFDFDRLSDNAKEMKLIQKSTSAFFGMDLYEFKTKNGSRSGEWILIEDTYNDWVHLISILKKPIN
jgi:hypothetical protein